MPPVGPLQVDSRHGPAPVVEARERGAGVLTHDLRVELGVGGQHVYERFGGGALDGDGAGGVPARPRHEVDVIAFGVEDDERVRLGPVGGPDADEVRDGEGRVGHLAPEGAVGAKEEEAVALRVARGEAAVRQEPHGARVGKGILRRSGERGPGLQGVRRGVLGDPSREGVGREEGLVGLPPAAVGEAAGEEQEREDPEQKGASEGGWECGNGRAGDNPGSSDGRDFTEQGDKRSSRAGPRRTGQPRAVHNARMGLVEWPGSKGGTMLLQ